MSTYGMPGVGYGYPTGTYGDLWGGVPSVAVPSPTFATGAVGSNSVTGSSARTAVAGSDGRSLVVGATGSTLTTERIMERIG